MIRRERERQGLSQVGLAELTDFTSNYIARVERGEKVISLAYAAQICKALRITLSSCVPPQIPRKVRRRRAFHIDTAYGGRVRPLRYQKYERRVAA